MEDSGNLASQPVYGARPHGRPPGGVHGRQEFPLAVFESRSHPAVPRPQTRQLIAYVYQRAPSHSFLERGGRQRPAIDVNPAAPFPVDFGFIPRVLESVHDFRSRRSQCSFQAERSEELPGRLGDRLGARLNLTTARNQEGPKSQGQKTQSACAGRYPGPRHNDVAIHQIFLDIVPSPIHNSNRNSEWCEMVELEEVLFLPPLAIARLGGSDSPLDSFTWIEDPSLHGAGLTVIDPTVSLEVQQDGSVRPFLPALIQFRDGNSLRPTAPFLELWAKVSGEDDLRPLTLALLAECGATLDSVSYTVTAANRKAARRTGVSACAFQASVKVLGNDHGRHPMLASSIGPQPLVFPERPIPLGAFQVIRPIPNRINLGVDLSVLRVRYTPAGGRVFGPPGLSSAVEPDLNMPSRVYEVVPRANLILNPDAAWTSYDSRAAKFNNPEPSDTYDGSDDASRGNLSYGVVDDTCDVSIEASVVLNGRTRKQAQARVFCGPPDFAPDRRPFVSLADDLIDRDPPASEPPEVLQEALDRLGDLFQRVYETASLANVDSNRQTLLSGQQRSAIPPATTLPQSMTPRDSPKYFDPTQVLSSPVSTHARVPFASMAQTVHAPLADVEDLALFLRENADLVRRLIRPPYGVFSELQANPAEDAKPDPSRRDPRIVRDTLHDMRMPPYMRDSDATALSLTRRQYQFLLDVLGRLESPAAGDLASVAAVPRGKRPPPAHLLTRVREHVQRVAERRGRPSGGGNK